MEKVTKFSDFLNEASEGPHKDWLKTETGGVIDSLKPSVKIIAAEIKKLQRMEKSYKNHKANFSKQIKELESVVAKLDKTIDDLKNYKKDL